MERYAAYERLRGGLWDLQRQFEVAGSRFLPLYHDLIWTPALEKWPAKEFDAFVVEERTDDPTMGELWEPWPEGIACSRYWGTITTFQRRVDTFRYLADRAFRIISAVGELAGQGYAVPKEMRAKISTLADAHHGWLELLSEAGLYVPSATLQTDNGWWRKLQPPKGAEYDSYPTCQSIQVDLFEASAEYLQMILEPGTVGFLRPCSQPLAIELAAGSVIERSQAWHPAIHFPEVPDVPVWDRIGRRLWFRGEPIREYARWPEAQGFLLDAFEEQGWPSEIPNPWLDRAYGGQVVPSYDALSLLEKTVAEIQTTQGIRRNLQLGTKNQRKVAYWYAR